MSPLVKSRSPGDITLPFSIASSIAVTNWEPVISNVTDSDDDVAAYAAFRSAPTLVHTMAAANAKATRRFRML